MRSTPGLRRSLIRSLIALSLSAALGCGTILYPDRRGQRGGQLDPGVIVLDAVGLVFFLVPGVVAFVVDFADGAIYLPKGQKSRILDLSAKHRSAELEIERYDLPNCSVAAIESELHTHAGVDIDLLADAIRIESRGSLADVETLLKSANQQPAGSPLRPDGDRSID